jgi:hypothetical protein
VCLSCVGFCWFFGICFSGLVLGVVDWFYVMVAVALGGLLLCVDGALWIGLVLGWC